MGEQERAHEPVGRGNNCYEEYHDWSCVWGGDDAPWRTTQPRGRPEENDEAVDEKMTLDNEINSKGVRRGVNQKVVDWPYHGIEPLLESKAYDNLKVTRRGWMPKLARQEGGDGNAAVNMVV